MVQAVVNFDSLQPVPKRGAALKAAQAEKRLHENFLRKIFGAAFIACHVSAVGHNSFLITQNQLFEGAQVRFRRAQGLPQEFFIAVVMILLEFLSHLSI